MPTPTLSPYEVDRNQRRDTSRRQKQRARLVLKHRQAVERVIILDHRASQLERMNQKFDRNEDGFQERAAADRGAWWCKVIFALAVALYVTGEFFASGDVAEWLAHQVAPLFAGSQDDAVASAQTPVWLRRGAGVGFAIIMLGVTLLLKFVTTWFAHGLEDRRSRAEAGDHVTYWRLTTGIWLNHLARVGYMAAVAMLYLWLFGFAQERAVLTAAIAADQKAVELTDLGIKIEGGEIETDEAVGKSETSKVSEITAGKLAYATGVVYVCLWLLHGLVLLLPTEGFGRELPLAHFKRGAAERRVESMREDEERTLRDILERIHAVEGEDREILIRETQPVAKRVNDAARRPAMDVPIPPGSEADPQETSAHQGQSPDGGAAETAATNNSSTPPGALGQYAAADAHEDVYRAIFDAPLPPKPEQRTWRQQP